MKKFALLVVLILAALLILGCTRGGNYNYGTGAAAYGQQQQQYPQQQQAYVGGGCAVAGPDLSEPLDNSEPTLAA